MYKHIFLLATVLFVGRQNVVAQLYLVEKCYTYSLNQNFENGYTFLKDINYYSTDSNLIKSIHRSQNNQAEKSIDSIIFYYNKFNKIEKKEYFLNNGNYFETVFFKRDSLQNLLEQKTINNNDTIILSHKNIYTPTKKMSQTIMSISINGKINNSIEAIVNYQYNAKQNLIASEEFIAQQLKKTTAYTYDANDNLISESIIDKLNASSTTINSEFNTQNQLIRQEVLLDDIPQSTSEYEYVNNRLTMEKTVDNINNIATIKYCVWE